MAPLRSAVAAALSVGLLITGCAVQSAGRPAVGTTGRESGGPANPPPTTPTTCADITYADGIDQIQSSLTDGDVLKVGRSGWLSSVDKVGKVRVAGDQRAVALREVVVATKSGCGRVFSSSRFVQVDAIGIGDVTLTYETHSGAEKTIRVTVRR